MTVSCCKRQAKHSRGGDIPGGEQYELIGRSGRDWSNSTPGEKFENITMMLFQPFTEGEATPWVKLLDVNTQIELTEQEYFLRLRAIYNHRNSHVTIEGEMDDSNEEE